MNISIIKKRLIEKKIYFIVILSVYVLGVILGLFLKTKLERLFFGQNVVDFYFNALTKQGTPFTIFLSEILQNVVVFILLYLLSFIKLQFVFGCVAVFYRGYVLGVVVLKFILSFGISGLYLFLFATLINSIICVLAISLYSVLALKSKLKCYAKNQTLIFLAACFAISAIGALIELFVIVLLIRPINYNF